MTKDKDGREINLPLRDQPKRYCERCGNNLRRWNVVASYCPWTGEPQSRVKVWCDHCQQEVKE